MTLTGWSIVGAVPPQKGGAVFHAVDPSAGQVLEPAFHAATSVDVDRAAQLAHAALDRYAETSGAKRATLLRAIAEQLDQERSVIVERAHRESGLPVTRLSAELGRTTGQLGMFADLVEEGSWVDARVDHGDPSRSAVPKPDVRSMLRPVGPVAVFGASNFPLAYSVAGNDTAAALAAGNPVIVKAHPAHPGTSEVVGQVVARAVQAADLPPGMFSVLFDADIDVGRALVQHPLVRAVGFTGSRDGGRALMDLAAERPEPIPVYAEMGSINPVFLLPDALGSEAEAIAERLHGSLMLGVGQYCTNPGLLLAPRGPALDRFLSELRQRISSTELGTMVSHRICRAYHEGLRRLADHPEVVHYGGERSDLERAPAETEPAHARAALFVIDAAGFLADRSLMAEVFGPATLLVRCRDLDEMITIARSLEGQLSATLFASEPELALARDLVRVLEHRVGRLVYSGVPTGVEVCPAMVHGGPYPATSDGQSSSVGTRAIFRFARPICYQGCPDAALPPELQDGNPLGILRLVDGHLTRG